MTHVSHAFELVWTVPNTRERDRLAKRLIQESTDESISAFRLTNKEGVISVSLLPKEKDNIIETYSFALSLMETYKGTTPVLYSRNHELGLQEVAVFENDSITIVNTPCI